MSVVGGRPDLGRTRSEVRVCEGFRMPAPPSWGRHPKTFTATEVARPFDWLTTPIRRVTFASFRSRVSKPSVNQP
jgi:hypothetical protein